MTATSDRFKDVVEPVRFLQYLSSPAAATTVMAGEKTSLGNTLIKPPFLFRIYSDTSDEDIVNNLVYMECAALTNIQPTFKGPWVGGFPTSCELRLTFLEYSPLFDEAFNVGNIGNQVITVREIGPKTTK